MSDLANKLLDSMSEEELAAYAADFATEEHIVIGDDRFITIPNALKRIAVQYDHDVETVIFDCPRFWDGIDLSKLKIYVNYMRADKVLGMCQVNDISIDEGNTNIMHFTWTISNNVTLVKGKVQFLVCAKKTDDEGMEIVHWNSELNNEMYVSEGLECTESIIDLYPDIITDLLTRMDYTETIATPEHMQEYINTFFTTGEGQKELANCIYNYMTGTYPTTPEMMQEYINIYLDNHPPLFVVGPNKPGVKCLWFNTGASGEVTENITVPMTGDSISGVYAEVKESEEVTDYKFDIV